MISIVIDSTIYNPAEKKEVRSYVSELHEAFYPKAINVHVLAGLLAYSPFVGLPVSSWTVAFGW
jgi:hypothetical protein